MSRQKKNQHQALIHLPETEEKSPASEVTAPVIRRRRHSKSKLIVGYSVPRGYPRGSQFDSGEGVDLNEVVPDKTIRIAPDRF